MTLSAGLDRVAVSDGVTLASRALFFSAFALLGVGCGMLALVDAQAANEWAVPACATILIGYIVLAASISRRKD